MIDTPTPTLFDVFFPERKKGAVKTIEQTDEGKQVLAWLRLHGAAGLWGGVSHDIAGGLHDVLQPSLGRIIGGAWNAYHEIQDMKEKTLADLRRIEHYRCGAQKIATKLEPQLELTVNGAPTGAKLTIHLTAALKLEALHLTIRQGRIESIEPGRCTLEGKLEIGSAKLPPVSRVIDLPGRITFEEGIPL